LAQPVFAQLLAAFCAFSGGLVFGLFYDALRALRLRAKSPPITLLCDLLVCLFGFFLLFYLAMSAGRGEIRLYMTLCALTGALVYFALLSRVFLAVFVSCLSFLIKIMAFVLTPLRYLLKMLVRLKNFFKNLFQKYTLWYKMRVNQKAQKAKEAQEAKASTEPPHNGRDDAYEIQTGQPDYEDCDRRDYCIRGHNPRVTESPGFGSAGGEEHAAGTGRQRASDKRGAGIRDRAQRRPRYARGHRKK
jgi:hypothetical protein